MLIRLFNQYEALNGKGEVIESRARIFIMDMMEGVRDLMGQEVSLRDLEAVVCGTISVCCAEERLRRAVEKRKSDREAKGAPLERDAE